MEILNVRQDEDGQGCAQRPSLSAFFSYGFRPFFLGSAAISVLLMSVWLLWIATVAAGGDGAWLPITGSPHAWHAHEMLLGFATAAIAGFLLTAVPNWTGALPLSGGPLVLLFGTWLAGRVAMSLSGLLPYGVAALADSVFLPLLEVCAARQLLVKPVSRNMIFLAILTLMASGNVAYHLEVLGFLSFDPMRALRLVLLAVAVMISIIGGRIIPSFTHNWIHLNAPHSRMPRSIYCLDVASISSIVALLVLKVVEVPDSLVGVTAIVATVLNGARLVLWRGWTARSEPIVWILHLGYLWLVLGLALNAAAALTSLVASSLALHALSTGAIGTMVLAVMSRAALGHTGRPIRASAAIVWAYGLVTLAAVLRALGPLAFPWHQSTLLVASGLAWIGAFSLFALVYAPILTTPRVYTKVARP